MGISESMSIGNGRHIVRERVLVLSVVAGLTLKKHSRTSTDETASRPATMPLASITTPLAALAEPLADDAGSLVSTGDVIMPWTAPAVPLAGDSTPEAGAHPEGNLNVLQAGQG